MIVTKVDMGHPGIQATKMHYEWVQAIDFNLETA